MGLYRLGINIYEKSNKIEPKIGFLNPEINSVGIRGIKFFIKTKKDKNAPSNSKQVKFYFNFKIL